MQKFRGILRVGFEIAFLVIISFGTFLRITWAAERVPPRAAKPAGNHPDHLAATALISAGGADLAYVVEGHASACPQTVDVGKCV